MRPHSEYEFHSYPHPHPTLHPHLQHSQEELLTLTEFVRNAKKKCLTGDVGGAMYVSGAPGVGKTQSVKQVLEKERDVVFLNCMDCSEKATLSNVLSTIARELREAAEKQILSDSADEEDEEEIKRTPAGKSKSKPKGKAKAAAMKSAVGKAPAAKKFVLPKTSSPSPPDDEDDDAHLQVQDDKAQPMKRKRIVTPGPPQKRGRASFATPANKGAAASSSAARPGARSSVARSTGGSVNKQTIPGKFAELQDIVESLQRPLILVLDEVDFFTNSLASGAARKSIRGCTAAKTKKTVKPDDPFPRLFQLPRRGKLVLVGIANSVGLIQSQMSVLNTLEDVEQLVFRPYAPEEMKAIMWL